MSERPPRRSPEAVTPEMVVDAHAEDTKHELKNVERLAEQLSESEGDQKGRLVQEIKRSRKNIERNTVILEEAHSQKAQEAHVDHLTQLLNRRGFESHFNAHFSLMERLHEEGQRAPFAVAIIDLDHFKSVNDMLGHNIGDAYLSGVAEVLHSHLRRESDIKARIGGDEFVVVLTDTEEESAKQTLEKVLEGIRHLSRRMKREVESGDKTWPDAVSASIGYVMFDPAKHHSGAEMLEDADRAMYEAKDSGKDSVSRLKI